MKLNRDSTAAIWTALAAAFLLGGYEFVRSPSNTLFKFAYGAENLTVVMALMPLGVLATIFVYSRMLSRLGARKTLFWTSIGSGAFILACYTLIRLGWKPATGILYLVREAYVVLVLEQYWSFINSSLSEASAKKWNGPITGIASLGAIGGGFLASSLAIDLGTEQLLLFGAFSLLPAAILSEIALRKTGEPQPKKTEKRAHSDLGLDLFRRSPILFSIIGLVMITQIFSAVTTLSFQNSLQVEIPNPDEQTAYSTQFFGYLNLLSAGLQFVGVPLLMRYLTLAQVHFMMPIVHLGMTALVIANPQLSTTAAAYLIFKSFDYSIFRAAKEILYIPLSFDSRYRAKELIDVMGYRFSKGGVSAIIAALSRAGFAVSGAYGWIAVGATLCWMALLRPITRIAQSEKSR